ncbi:hypothetical protein [Cupriavidus sp. IDO]|nr:hypothetical protein [Cupriavidus sp. IDO]
MKVGIIGAGRAGIALAALLLGGLNTFRSVIFDDMKNPDRN